MHDYLSISSICVVSAPNLRSSSIPGVSVSGPRSSEQQTQGASQDVLSTERLTDLLAAQILTGRSLTAYSMQAVSKQHVLLMFFLLTCQQRYLKTRTVWTGWKFGLQDITVTLLPMLLY